MGKSVFVEYVKVLRVAQWLKNLMLFFPPFLSGTILEQDAYLTGVLLFFAFSFISSCGYIVNDIIDLENDRHHPHKKYRPLASGVLSLRGAIVVACSLVAVAIGICLITASYRMIWYLLVYLAVSLLYSVKFKEIPLVDIFCIGSGFIIRLEAGGSVFAVPISSWLFLTVFLLAIFLSIGKRLTEKQSLGSNANLHRKSLAGYPDGFLDGAMYLTGGAVLVTYSMYTLSRGHLFYTVPLCCFGLLRYILRVKSGQSGDPTESLLKDVPLLVVSLAWATVIGWSLYF